MECCPVNFRVGDCTSSRHKVSTKQVQLQLWKEGIMNYAILGAGKVGQALAVTLLATITMAPAVAIPATSHNVSVKTIFSHPISNVPGKSLVAQEVSYPPGGASAPHRHPVFVYAYVISGQIASQVEGQPERIYRAGESWYETPGAHHLIGRNASNTEPAKLLAVYIADTGDNVLTIPDQAGGSK
jgi:quercetin dioxygenase-like cupin family protein